MEADTVLVIGRVVERIVIIFFCGMSLWFGWKLFYRATDTSDQSGNITWKSFALNFQKVGPGIFFALFGAAVLAIALRSPLVAHTTADEKETFRYLGGSADITKQLVALNNAYRIASLPKTATIQEVDREAFSAGRDTYQTMRLAILQQVVKPEEYSEWRKYRALLDEDPDAIPEASREAVSRVQSMLTKWKLP